MLQQRCAKETGTGIIANAPEDPFDAACSDVVGACLSSLEAAGRTVTAAQVRLFEPSSEDRGVPPSNVEVMRILELKLP